MKKLSLSRNALCSKCNVWSVKGNSNMGSWMWRTLLKYREVARSLHQVEIRNGSTTSFWYDTWSKLGRLIDITGSRGVIDMGIPLEAVEAVLNGPRRRRHRVPALNAIETEISDLQHRDRSVDNYIFLWRYSGDKFKKTFSTKATWNIIRTPHPRTDWYKGIWFSYATPKYSFLAWLAVHDRLSTGDRIKHWNSGQRVDCILCDRTEESRNHLFFTCQYSSTVWRSLSQGLLANDNSTDWQQLVTTISSSNLPKTKTFLISVGEKEMLGDMEKSLCLKPN